MKKKELIISLVLKLGVAILVFIAIIIDLVKVKEIHNLKYFTQLSNIFAAIVALIYVVYDILELKGKKIKAPKWLNYVKLAATVGVTLTFVVFWTLLSWNPLLPKGYLYSYKNLSLHTFGPLLMITNYIMFTDEYYPTLKRMATSLIPPILYFVFASILIAKNITFGDEIKAPYFFLDYKEYGWFQINKNGIGVFYWVIIMIIIVYGLTLALTGLYRLCIKKKEPKVISQE